MIVITAPTGRIGRLTLDRLLAADAPVRVIVRDPARIPAAIRDRVEIVPGSHGDADVVAKAFAGADALFWLPPPNPAASDPDTAIVDFSRPASEALQGGDVRRVVSISALGRGTPWAGNAGHVTASLAMDDLLAATGVHFRALTMSSFMENLLWQTELIRDHGMFTGPNSGTRALPTCAVADIAAAAAELLRDDSWDGVAEAAVLGPEDLSSEDMARIMSEVLGRPIRFQHVPGAEYAARMTQFGTSEGMARALVEMALAKDAGLDNAVPRTAANTGPTTFRQWCEEVLRPAVLA